MAIYPDSSEEWNLSSTFRRSRERPRHHSANKAPPSNAFTNSGLASSIWSEDLEPKVPAFHERSGPPMLSSYAIRPSASRRNLSRAEEFELNASEEEKKEQLRSRRIVCCAILMLLVVGVAGGLLLYYRTDFGSDVD